MDPNFDTIPPSSPNTTTDDTIFSEDGKPNTDKQNNDKSIINKKRVVWSPENEVIMVEWCDVAQCYKWLNTRSHAKYSYMHAWFTIPAIIFSTVSGTASFAQDSFPENIRSYAPAVIGSINIIIGILTTIQQYLKISELNEAHRVSSIAWDKFARNIRIELSKNPDERNEAGPFIKQCRNEFDRLMETSPDITEQVVHDFKKKFAGVDGSLKRKQYEALKKPDICDTIVSANETRHKWYLELDTDVNDMNDDITDAAIRAKNQVINDQKRLIADRENEILNKKAEEENTARIRIETMKLNKAKLDERDNYINSQVSKINIYVNNFNNIYERKPLREEIMDNMKNEIDGDILDIFFATYTSI